MERKLGMSNGSFASAVEKSQSVKDKIIRKTLEVFPTISLRWLVLGEGEIEDDNSNPYHPDKLAMYISLNHEKLKSESMLYRTKMENLAKDEAIVILDKLRSGKKVD
ncbi:MAG: hypothetical protein AAF600_13085 [Bacteroidota bacterium]